MKRMTTIILHPDVRSVGGSVWFSKDVPQDSLLKAVAELAMQADLQRTIDLHVRPGGDDGSHIVAFHYTMLRGSKREQERITREVINHFKRVLMIGKRDMSWTISTIIARIVL